MVSEVRLFFFLFQRLRVVGLYLFGPIVADSLEFIDVQDGGGLDGLSIDD